MNGGCMNFAVVSGAVERQTPFYKGVWGVKMSTDVARWRFTAVFVADTEWDEVLWSVGHSVRRGRWGGLP
jgi:hypothetical protein